MNLNQPTDYAVITSNAPAMKAVFTQCLTMACTDMQAINRLSNRAMLTQSAYFDPAGKKMYLLCWLL